MLGLDREERELHHKQVRKLFMRKVEKSVNAARGQAMKLPWGAPAALTPPAGPTPAALPNPDRHADLRAALLENPDQPQADFVKLCRVHPNTVRRTRRELEEAGAIPFLAHRHAA
jgi:hypothetical protein